MRFLKQNTTVAVNIGPFLDDTDGKTAETALTIAYTAVYLSKNGGAFAAKQQIVNPNHSVNGQYLCGLSATDTNTLGTLRLSVVVTGALPVWEDFMVIPAAVYDAFVGGTANMPSDVIAISGDTIAADNCEAFFDGTGYAGTNNVIPSVTTVTGNVNGSVGSVIGSVGSVTGAVGSVTGNVGGSVGSVTGAVTVGAVNTDAITGAAIKADAVTKIAAGVFAYVVEGTRTFKDHVRLAIAALCGKAAGGGTSTVVFRDAADAKNRISMTVDANGNRTAVTLDATD